MFRTTCRKQAIPQLVPITQIVGPLSYQSFPGSLEADIKSASEEAITRSKPMALCRKLTDARDELSLETHPSDLIDVDDDPNRSDCSSKLDCLCQELDDGVKVFDQICGVKYFWKVSYAEQISQSTKVCKMFLEDHVTTGNRSGV